MTGAAARCRSAAASCVDAAAAALGFSRQPDLLCACRLRTPGCAPAHSALPPATRAASATRNGRQRDGRAYPACAERLHLFLVLPGQGHATWRVRAAARACAGRPRPQHLRGTRLQHERPLLARHLRRRRLGRRRRQGVARECAEQPLRAGRAGCTAARRGARGRTRRGAPPVAPGAPPAPCGGCAAPPHTRPARNHNRHGRRRRTRPAAATRWRTAWRTGRWTSTSWTSRASSRRAASARFTRARTAGRRWPSKSCATSRTTRSSMRSSPRRAPPPSAPPPRTAGAPVATHGRACGDERSLIEQPRLHQRAARCRGAAGDSARARAGGEPHAQGAPQVRGAIHRGMHAAAQPLHPRGVHVRRQRVRLHAPQGPLPREQGRRDRAHGGQGCAAPAARCCPAPCQRHRPCSRTPPKRA